MGVGAIALGLAALFLPACGQVAENGEDNVTSEDLAQAPDQYVGQTVTIRSEITEEVGNTGLALATEEAAEPILVVNTTGATFTLPDPEIGIQATGEVVQFNLAEVESEYGLDLEDELYTDYENTPAVIAESLALAPTPEELAETPLTYYENQVIAVKGEVGGLFTPDSFSLYEEGWIDDIGILVVSAADVEFPTEEMQEGEMVVVTGIVRPFDAAVLQQEYGLEWDEEIISEFEARYTERPVIVADDVYPSAVDL